MQQEYKGKIYIGVYGIYVQDRRILVIKKARGPYTDLYDLPGGGIDFMEKIEDSLRREMKEETNAAVEEMKFLGINEYICEYMQGAIQKVSHHIGAYYAVKLHIESLKLDADGEDSLGAVFLPFDEVQESNISPIAYPIIKEYIQSL